MACPKKEPRSRFEKSSFWVLYAVQERGFTKKAILGIVGEEGKVFGFWAQNLRGSFL